MKQYLNIFIISITQNVFMRVQYYSRIHLQNEIFTNFRILKYFKDENLRSGILIKKNVSHIF